MNPIFGGAPVPNVELTPRNCVLRISSGPAAGKDFRVDRVRVLIGRAVPPLVAVDFDLNGCETEPSVSRRHAELQWIDGGLHVVDLCSANGTTVDGQKLRCPANCPSDPHPLRAGSKLKFGALEAEVVRDDQ